MSRVLFAGVVFAAGFVAPVAADDATLKTLAGSYTAVAVLKDGKAVPADVLAGFTAKISGDELTMTVKGKAFPAKITVDPKKTPAHIDIAPTDGPEKGRTFPGLYKWEAGELVVAYAERIDRPEDFSGAGGVLVRLKKDVK